MSAGVLVPISIAPLFPKASTYHFGHLLTAAPSRGCIFTPRFIFWLLIVLHISYLTEVRSRLSSLCSYVDSHAR